MRKSFIVLFIIFIGCYLHAADYNITGAGARAAGLGGAFIAVADDATAISWNPAGLTQLYRPEISLVTKFIAEDWEYKSSYYDNESDKQSHFAFNFASAAYPLMNGKLVMAIAYQQQLDWYSDWEDEDDKSTGGANSISSGLAFRLLPIFSLGFTTNIWLGNWIHDDVWAWHPDEYDYDYVDRTITFSGLNFVFGLMVDFNNLGTPVPLKFGATMRTPFDLEDIIDSTGVDIDSIVYIKIIDVIGCIQNEFVNYDSQANKINEPWPTPFHTCGFDLDAVGLIHLKNNDINELSDIKENVSLYPNPIRSGELFTVKFNDLNGEKKVTVFNITGKLVYRKITTENIIHINSSILNEEFYILQIETKETLITKKIVILK